MSGECDVTSTLSVMGKRHALVVLEEILLGNYNGFNHLSKRIAITPKVLSQRLKEMKQEALIVQEGEVYAITEKGRAVGNILLQLKEYQSKTDSHYPLCDKITCSDCRERNHLYFPSFISAKK